MLFRVAEGAATPIWESGSEVEAVERIVSLVRSGDRPLAAVGHAGRASAATADRLAHRLDEAGVVGVERYRIGASIGAHTGADSFGAFWWPALSR
jgi:fatty acid-binding protein DegV